MQVLRTAVVPDRPCLVGSPQEEKEQGHSIPKEVAWSDSSLLRRGLEDKWRSGVSHCSAFQAACRTAEGLKDFGKPKSFRGRLDLHHEMKYYLLVGSVGAEHKPPPVPGKGLFKDTPDIS